MNFVKYMVQKVRAFGVSQLLAIQQECGQREESTQYFLPLSKLWPTSQHSAVDWNQNMSLGEMNVFSQPRQQGMERRVGISTDAHHRPNTGADGTSFPWAFCPQISKDSNSGSMEGTDDGLPYICLLNHITLIWTSFPVSALQLSSWDVFSLSFCATSVSCILFFFSGCLSFQWSTSSFKLWERSVGGKMWKCVFEILYFVLMFDCYFG